MQLLRSDWCFEKHHKSLPRIRSAIFAAVLNMLIASALGAQSDLWAETYRGKVVDAETGEPLEGAVFVITWHKRPFITMNGPQYFHSANEGLTDGKGEFSVDGSPGVDWNPFTYIMERPHIAIFKPGYAPFPVGHLRETRQEETEQEMITGGALVKLPRLKTEQEMKQYTGPANMRIPSDVPYNEIPNLIKLINSHRKSIGFSPIGKLQ
jgi:hypothetical protein